MVQIRIRNREELVEWLEGQPREVAVAIAARAAMRVLPVLETWLAEDEEEKEAAFGVLLLFRALAVSRMAALDSNQNSEMRQIIDRTIKSILFHAASFPEYFRVKNSILSAFGSLLTSLDGALIAHEAVDVLSHVSLLISDMAWQSTESDANIWAQRTDGSISDFVCEALWPDGMPEELRKRWDSMKKRLLARKGEHWEVWTNWYDARLDPSRRIPCYSPPIPELERKRILLPEEVWEAGPATANAEIRRLIDEHDCARQSLRQAPAPYVFEEREGRIIAEPYRGEIHDPVLAEEMRAALCERAREVVELLRGKQVPGRVANTIERLVEVLGDSLQDVEPGRLLFVSRALEADLDAYDSEDGRQNLGEDGFAALRELALFTTDLRAQFQAITDMLARADAQKILEMGIDKAEEARQQMIDAVRQAPGEEIDKESVLPALTAANADIAEVREEHDATFDEERQANLRLKWAQLLSVDLLSHRNFMSRLVQKARAYAEAARKDVQDGKGGVRVALEKGAYATLIIGALSPIAGAMTGLTVAGLAGWSILKREADAILAEWEKGQGDDDERA